MGLVSLEPLFQVSEAPEAECKAALSMQLERCVRAAEGAISANAERAVRSDLGIHAEWYLDRVRKALPASAETVASFIDAMAETRKPATVRR